MTSNKACMNCWENTAETLPWKAGYQRPNQETAANQNQSMSMDFGGTHSSHVLDRFCLLDRLCRRYTTTLHTRMVSAKVHVWLHAVKCIAGLSTSSKFRIHWFCNRAADVTCHTVPLWCFRRPGWYVLSTSSGSDLQLSFPPWSPEISCLWPKSECRTCHIRSRCNSMNSDSNCVADSALCTCRVHWISAPPSWGVCQWNVMEYGFASWESTQSAQCPVHQTWSLMSLHQTKSLETPSKPYRILPAPASSLVKKGAVHLSGLVGIVVTRFETSLVSDSPTALMQENLNLGKVLCSRGRIWKTLGLKCS